MKRLFLRLTAGLILSTPNVFADDDEEIPQNPPQEENDGGSNGNNNGNNNNGQTPNQKPVEIKQPSQIPGPRSLSPIEGLYSDGVVTLYFAADLGCVSITILSTTNGNMWFESGESCEGFVEIPVGCERGEYAITIETENAGVFVANFYL